MARINYQYCDVYQKNPMETCIASYSYSASITRRTSSGFVVTQSPARIFPPRLTEGVPARAACLCVAVHRDGWCGFCLKHLLHGLPAGQQLPFGEMFVRG